MPPRPYEWNVVVNGSWNPAILTPEGIGRRLFLVEPGTALEVHVSLDHLAPIKVIHNNILAMVSNQRLLVAPTGELNTAALQTAATIVARALESLPETPLSAVGVNIRYRFDTVADELIAISGSSVDDQIADAGFRITDKMLRRGVEWHEGELNMEFAVNRDSSALVQFNFHRGTKIGREAREWVGRVNEMAEAAAATMDRLGLTLGQE